MAELVFSHRFAGVDKKEIGDLGDFKITFKETYNWDNFYEMFHEYFVDEGYAPRNDAEFKEILYQHIERSWGSEMWVRWRLSKEATKSFKGLFRYDIDIDMHILGQTSVELVIGGKKIKAHKGEIEVNAKGYLIIDPKGEIRNNWLGQHFYDFVFNVFLKKTVKGHMFQLMQDMQRAQDAVKTYLKLETYLPERELGEFYTKRDGS